MCDRRRRAKVTEYQRISKVCRCCGAVTTPGWDDKAVPLEHAGTVAAPGSPVRIGPDTLARAALLTCAHYLPIGRARDLLEALTGSVRATDYSWEALDHLGTARSLSSKVVRSTA